MAIAILKHIVQYGILDLIPLLPPSARLKLSQASLHKHQVSIPVRKLPFAQMDCQQYGADCKGGGYQMSAAKEYGWLLILSGDMYVTVPRKVLHCTHSTFTACSHCQQWDSDGLL